MSRWPRRLVRRGARWALALALASSVAGALAQGGRGEEAPRPGAPALHGRPDRPSPGAGESGSTAGDSHVLVAPLRFASEGTLVVDGGRVEAEGPWPRYLAPGMWLRAEGVWDGDVFRASALTITRPASFSYYLGPAATLELGDGWVEAWFAGSAPGEGVTLLELRRVPAGAEPRALVEARVGRWLALPPGLRPPPPDGFDGWTLVRGEVTAGAVHWLTASPFP